jgi:membrane protease YdiL (CAAX protease family)
MHVTARISEARLRFLFTYEIIVGLALVTFLRRRGWTASSVGSRPSIWDPLIGLGLAGVTLLCIVALFSVTAALVPRLQLAPVGGFISGQLALPTVVAVSIVNPVFEELFVAAFVIASLTKQGARIGTAVTVSIAIRLFYHLYLGVVAAAFVIIPMGLIFGYYFARRRRLWPIVVAHAAIDFLALGV